MIQQIQQQLLKIPFFKNRQDRIKIQNKIDEFKKLHPKKDIIVVIQTGSHLFKLNTKNSDLDITGIYIPEPSEFLNKQFSKEINLNSNQKNTANTKDDVDCKFISIFRFIELLEMGEFNAMEWLFAPQYSIIFKTPLWDSLNEIKEDLLIFDISSFLGFIKREFSKAGFTGNLKEEMSQVLSFLKLQNRNETLQTVIPELKSKFHFLKFKNSKVNNGNKNANITGMILATRMFQETVKINYIIEQIEEMLSKSTTSHRKDLSGKDIKGFYHSQRLVFEANHLLEKRSLCIPFPKKEQKILMNIRKNKINIEELQESIFDQISHLRKLEKTVENTNYNAKNLIKLKINLFNFYEIQAIINKNRKNN